MEVLVQVVSALFDINPSMNTHMAVPLWKRCVKVLLEVGPRLSSVATLSLVVQDRVEQSQP